MSGSCMAPAFCQGSKLTPPFLQHDLPLPERKSSPAREPALGIGEHPAKIHVADCNRQNGNGLSHHVSLKGSLLQITTTLEYAPNPVL